MGMATTAAVIGAAGIAAGASQASKARKQAKSQQDIDLALTAQDRARIAEAQQQSRRDVTRLFAPTQAAQQAGQQAALDIFGQGVPEQARLFQGGNVAAQQQLIGGLQPFQQALLGQPINFGALQPTQLTPNLDFIQNAQLPQFTPVAEALATPTGTADDPFTIAETEEQLAQRMAVLDQPFEGGRFTPIQIRDLVERGVPLSDMALAGVSRDAIIRAGNLIADTTRATPQVDVFGNPVGGSTLPTLTPEQRAQFQQQRTAALGGMGTVNPTFTQLPKQSGPVNIAGLLAGVRRA